VGVAWPSGGFRHHTSVLNRGRRGIPHGVVPHTAWYPTRRGIPCGAVPHGLVFHTARRGIAYGVVSHVDKRWRSCVRERCFHHASSAAHHSLPTRGHAMGYEVRVVRGIAPALRSMLGRHLSPELQTKRTQSGAWLPIVLSALRGQLQWRVRRNSVDRHDDQGVAGFSGWRCVSALDSSSLSAVRTCSEASALLGRMLPQGKPIRAPLACLCMSVSVGVGEAASAVTP
jgi:hypothetical protein